MNKNTIKNIIIIILVAVAIVIGLAYVQKANNAPGEYDGLATCLKDKGVKFYGAFWCPHCRDQKKEFGNSAKLLPYIECSTPDASGQLQTCIDAKIDSYPTWEFPDGSRLSQVIPVEELAQKTSCPLQGYTGTTTATSTAQ